MGQEQSGASLRLERDNRSRKAQNRSVEKTTKISTLKNLKLITNSSEILIKVTDDTLTCGWLLSEAIRAHSGPEIIVGLKTQKKIEILDVWLSMFERSLQPFKESDFLEPVFGLSVSQNVQFSHFVPLKLIGKGGFSQVVMARKKDNGQLYAIKVMKKEFVIKEEKVPQIITERNILSKASHPFIVKLNWAFQSVSYK